jgi:hypothetical protein
MKKASIGKLTLTKETIANLGLKELNVAKGGQVTKWCWTGEHCTFGCTGPAVTPGTACC